MWYSDGTAIITASLPNLHAIYDEYKANGFAINPKAPK